MSESKTTQQPPDGWSAAIAAVNVAVEDGVPHELQFAAGQEAIVRAREAESGGRRTEYHMYGTGLAAVEFAARVATAEGGGLFIHEAAEGFLKTHTRGNTVAPTGEGLRIEDLSISGFMVNGSLGEEPLPIAERLLADAVVSGAYHFTGEIPSQAITELLLRTKWTERHVRIASTVGALLVMRSALHSMYRAHTGKQADLSTSLIDVLDRATFNSMDFARALKLSANMSMPRLHEAIGQMVTVDDNGRIRVDADLASTQRKLSKTPAGNAIKCPALHVSVQPDGPSGQQPDVTERPIRSLVPLVGRLLQQAVDAAQMTLAPVKWQRPQA